MNIIINGGTRGIGKEIALNLCQNPSNKIIVTGRNTKALAHLSAVSDNIKTIRLDLSSHDTDYSYFLTSVMSHFSQIDILINNAGLLISKGFIDIDESDARRMIETNFLGPSLVIRYLKPLMSKGSHIVNITSMGGFQGSVKFNGLAYYSASKAALASLSESLANEFAKDEIRINCLALGAVQTEMLEEAFPGYKAPVTAKEMAEFISYFALNGHKFFNGKILPVAVTTP
jgi:NAD(P)-dependent dehydrogenase (short-subunit alcohol dehydrogenase family)